MADVFEAGALMVRGGLLFRVRASGDLAAVVMKAGGSIVEIPIKAAAGAAASVLVASAASVLKGGFKHLSPAEFDAAMAEQAKLDAINAGVEAEKMAARKAEQVKKDEGEAVLKALAAERAKAKEIFPDA